MLKLPLFRLALAGMLAVTLAACGQGDTSGSGAASGDKIAPVAAPAGKQWADVVSRTPEGGWLAGNPAAPIKLVEYGSLTCPACAGFAGTAAQPLRDKYVNSGRVSFEIRSVPIHGAVDLVLTRLIECAPLETAHPLAEQVWANLNAILAPIQANEAALGQAMQLPDNQRLVAYAERAKLLEFFAARGISVDQGRQCLTNFPAAQTLAQKLQAQAEKDEVNSTPTFFLNGSKLEERGWPEIEMALQNAGAR